MPIHTPRGLKIRIDTDQSFALMARLFPKVKPYTILKTTEAIDQIPKALLFLSALAAFMFVPSYLAVFLATASASLLGLLLTISGLYKYFGLHYLGHGFNSLSGDGLIYIGTVTAGYLASGWVGVAAFAVGRLTAFGLNNAIEFLYTKQKSANSGSVVTSSEAAFLSAYRLHASKVNENLDTTVTEKELQEDNWRPAYEHLQKMHPGAGGKTDYSKMDTAGKQGEWSVAEEWKSVLLFVIAGYAFWGGIWFGLGVMIACLYAFGWKDRHKGPFGPGSST